MDNALKLRVMFDMIDNITKPLKTILAGNKGLASSLKETRAELADMGKSQKTVAMFRELRAGAETTSTKLTAATARVRELTGSLRAFGPPSQQMTAELAKAKQAASNLRAEQKQQNTTLDELRTRLSAAGIDTRNLSQHERELRTNIAATTATMNAQMQRLDAIADREKRVASARKSMQTMQGVAGSMAVAGYAAKSTGQHVFADLHESIDQAKKVQNERGRIGALGLGDEATKDAEKYARAMKMMGVSTSDNMTLMRDSMSIFADEHHAQMAMPVLAKMKFANEAMFGAEEGHENEEKFMNMLKVIELRGGTKDEGTFKSEADKVQKVLSATGGRVGGDEWKNFIQTGKTAAKQMRQDAFYYQMEPLIQEMGGHAAGTGVAAAYSNLMQGKTTVRAAKRMVELGLVDKKNVEFNKIGNVSRIKPGALIEGDLYKASPFEWMEKVLLPKLKAKGITDQSKILDEFGTIMTNGNGANLFATMYMQRAQIHKSEKLNQGAYGIDQLHSLASKQTEGRELDAMAKMRDLQLEIGEHVAPLYNAALDKIRLTLGAIIDLAHKHSTTAKIVLSFVAAIAAVLVILGTLTIVLAGVLGPMAVVKFSMQTLGMKGGYLARGLGLASSAMRLFGTAAMWAGRALLTTPIGWITLGIAAIAGAAYLIYQNWQPISAFFIGVWNEVRSAFDSGISAIGALFVNWSPFGLLYRGVVAGLGMLGIDLPAQFSDLGGHLISGLVNGITTGLGAVKDAITNVASSTVGWFKEKLGIHSPSRVFAELGGFVAQGAALGMEGEQGRISKAAVAMATVATTAFGAPDFAKGASAATVPLMAPRAAAPMLDRSALPQNERPAVVPFVGDATRAPAPLVRPSTPIDTRPPIAAAPGAGVSAAPAGPSPIIINIYPQAGDDPKAIGRAVAAELDRRERSKRARAGSNLSD
ncbi:phage tail tape measure protein [Paraburkholderia bannensis]|uniref:phage tail tape measure protein n=1 Tax=Paraburkholderia bannensis TaxID=765414 RepID=UPI0004876F7F|nr:membrane protein [Paraburkholderia bannensis]